MLEELIADVDLLHWRQVHHEGMGMQTFTAIQRSNYQVIIVMKVIEKYKQKKERRE
ncbi:hypothetical protein DKN87_24110, partial [Salmonella enterica]|nr:hypothetical protein [Salmonella enterica]